jgi:acyl-CoA synthetase (AMP-forming)/AMP-acid ligase II/acyl carrier protein
MHQAALAAAPDHQPRLAKHSLRFIRSCSSALPPLVMDQLEKTFGVPVVEAYGMTEAAHQMTCNPLPPAARKAGSVGVPTGLEVAIMDESGALLPVGRRGEVVIRGHNVTSGYANNPEANQKAFTQGWFRTGDQGCFDEDGYLFLTGRIKEMINRGGENISPREIDEALMAHPGVAQAITFAVPHPTLGESVAAAIVKRSGASATAREIRDFVAERLSDFKVPQQIVFVDAIPKGPTGKPQRIGLAEKLGLAGAAAARHDASAGPVGRTESTLAGIWRDLLSIPKVHADDSFFQIGGDSLRATQMLRRAQDELHVELDLSCVFEFPTLKELARHVDSLLASNDSGKRREWRQAG